MKRGPKRKPPAECDNCDVINTLIKGLCRPCYDKKQHAHPAYRKQARKYYNANKQKCLDRSKQWNENNIDKYRDNARRSRLKAAIAKAKSKEDLNKEFVRRLVDLIEAGFNASQVGSLVGVCTSTVIKKLIQSGYRVAGTRNPIWSKI